MRRLFLLSVISFLMCGGQAHAENITAYTVRVIVDDDVPLIKVSANDVVGYQLRRPFTLEPLIVVPRTHAIVVRPVSEGLEINGVLFKIAGVVIEPLGVSRIKANNRWYEGMIGVQRKDNDSVQLLNVLDLETYLSKVVGNEMPKDWPLEALKAQAIVSRTYVLSRMRDNLYSDFDVSSTTKDQVANLNGSVPPSVQSAVEQTRGMVLLYHGDIFPAYFHSTCGGRTKDASWYWDSAPIEPLQGVSCNKCSLSPFYRWHKEFSKNEFTRALRQKGILVSNLSSVSVNTSSKGKELVLNRSQKISTYRLRTLLGDAYLRSPDIQIEFDGSHVYVQGRGWGHGAGLCQWGARKLADEGKKYPFILDWYYPKATIGMLEEYAQ